jgi:RNA polymerase sigma factor (sigma-70 family)
MRSDEELYRDFLDGNAESFDALVLAHRVKLIRFVQSYVSDPYMAEDISQDVFVDLLVNPERFDFKYSFKTFLYLLAKHRAADHLRKRRLKMQPLDQSDDTPDDESVEEIVLGRLERRQTAAAATSLKHDYRVVLYLVDGEEMSYADAGRVMQKNAMQVTNLVHRARKALKSVLEREAIHDEK